MRKKKISGKSFSIGIDIDNVISDTYSAFVEEFNNSFGTKIKYEDIIDFYYLEKSTGIEETKARNFIYQTIESQEFTLKLKPYEDALMVISKWLKEKYLIHYITARPISLKAITKTWLKNHGFMTNGVKLDLWNPEDNLSDIEFKKRVVEDHKIDIIIEDHIDIASIMNIPVLLIDRPWNRGRIDKKIKRVKNWQEIDNIVQNIA